MSKKAVVAALARVLFQRGEVDQAIDAQRRAIRLSEPPQRDMLRKVLDGWVARSRK